MVSLGFRPGAFHRGADVRGDFHLEPYLPHRMLQTLPSKCSKSFRPDWKTYNDTAFQEAAVPLHHEGSIEGPPETHRTSSHPCGSVGFKGGCHLGPY